MIKFVVMVPVEVSIADQSKVGWLFHDFQTRGPYPSVSGGSLSWRTRFDKVKLKDIRAALNSSQSKV